MPVQLFQNWRPLSVTEVDDEQDRRGPKQLDWHPGVQVTEEETTCRCA